MRWLLAFMVSALMVNSASADISWNITYEDGASSTGFGTGSAEGLARRSTFEAALNLISNTFDTPNDVTLDFVVQTSQTDGTGFLASAGTFFFDTDGYTNGVLYQHAQTGVDPTGSPDGFATFDFGYNWNNENDIAAFNEFDLFTVSVHEIVHSLGVLSLVDGNGESRIGGGNDPATFSVMNTFMELGDGTDLFAAGPDGEFLGTAADLISDDIFFNGANAVAANGGERVKIYAPGTFALGSSLSHVDTATYPDAIMTHAIGLGVSKKEFSAIDIGIIQDIGWALKISAIPEPGSVLLFSIGLGFIVPRRRRS